MLVINYGKDWVKTTYDALAVSDIGIHLKNKDTVSIKPNLVTPQGADNGATTHPEVIEGIIRFLKDNKIQKISIIENSAVGYSTKQAFKVCGYEALQKKYDVPLIDLSTDNQVTLKSHGYDIRVFEKALNADFLINVPVLKAHCQTRLTCCMKNLKGCIPHDEMKRFHSLGLHKPIAALNAIIKTHYNVVDGICGDLSFEEGGTPVEANRIITGQNPILVDSYCAELIGYKPDEIGYLSYGKQYGIGEYYSNKTKIIELNAANKPLKQKKSDLIANRYRNLIEEDAACSVCYAALIFALQKGAKIQQKICIGQGFKSKSGDGVGIGNCTCGFKTNLKGCPPKAAEIAEFLK
jgi:uncharacterized protein (DUF362 family)